jgi:hypothetical protein
MAVFKLNSKHCVGQRFKDRPFSLYHAFFLRNIKPPEKFLISLPLLPEKLPGKYKRKHVGYQKTPQMSIIFYVYRSGQNPVF